jgi:spore coat protein U-like protein
MTRAAAVVVALALAARPAGAVCVIDGVTGLAFGSYDTLSASPLDTTGSIIYKCLLSLTITIDISTGSSTSYAARTMTKAGGGTLAYNLFLDVTRMQVWGNTSSGTVHYGPFLGLLVDTAIPVFGRIPAGQDVATGNYSDTVVVTLNY